MTAMTSPDPVDELVQQGAQLLAQYAETRRTDILKEQLAPLVVDLRGSFTLENGRPDWSGRTPGYRAAIADMYRQSRIPEPRMDSVLAALRYHVGNLLRERASSDELVAVGLQPTSPKDRLTTAREAQAAQREVTAPRQDMTRLTTYAQALLDYADEATIADLQPEEVIASRIALERIQTRAAELLVRIADATRGRLDSGPRRRGRKLGSV